VNEWNERPDATTKSVDAAHVIGSHSEILFYLLASLARIVQLTKISLTGSREQNYRPEDCSLCHQGLVGKKGHGFWEGGKGTRDKSRMSRKDPRKFKRAPGGTLRKEKKEKKG
jgi:hypothetical protein